MTTVISTRFGVQPRIGPRNVSAGSTRPRIDAASSIARRVKDDPFIGSLDDAEDVLLGKAGEEISVIPEAIDLGAATAAM